MMFSCYKTLLNKQQITHAIQNFTETQHTHILGQNKVCKKSLRSK